MFSTTVSGETPHLSADLPCRLTDDSGGLHGGHDLLQGFQVRVIVSKLLLLVVKMTSSLNLGQNVLCSFQNCICCCITHAGTSVRSERVTDTRYLYNETF